MKDWLEIWKSEIPPSESCSISEDWGELGISNLAWMSWMLLNAAKCQGYSFYCIWVIKVKGKSTGRGWGVKLLRSPLPRLGIIVL